MTCNAFERVVITSLAEKKRANEQTSAGLGAIAY